MTDRLGTRADFQRFQQDARQRWEELWQGERLIVSVGVDSSSEPKGALRVLAACREALSGTDAIVREVSGNGAMWMEPAVEIKRPGEPPVVYGWVEPEDVPTLLAGGLPDRAVGVRGPEALGDIPPLGEHPFFKHQVRIVMEDFGVIEPDSIEDAIARGAYGARRRCAAWGITPAPAGRAAGPSTPRTGSRCCASTATSCASSDKFSPSALSSARPSRWRAAAARGP